MTKQDVINRSLFESKPTKPAAQELLLALFEGLTDEQQEQYIADIAQLWNWFMPAAPKIPTNDTAWVAQAVSKDPTRRPLTLMYSDGSWLYGCDSARAHRAPTTLEPGYYLPSGDPVVHDASYDGFKQIIDKFFLGGHDAQLVNMATLPVKEVKEVLTVTLAGKCLNRAYVLQVIGKATEAWVAPTDQNAVVIYPNDGNPQRRAVVMSIKD